MDVHGRDTVTAENLYLRMPAHVLQRDAIHVVQLQLQLTHQVTVFQAEEVQVFGGLHVHTVEELGRIIGFHHSRRALLAHLGLGGLHTRALEQLVVVDRARHLAVVGSHGQGRDRCEKYEDDVAHGATLAPLARRACQRRLLCE
jgi:hypothetical protein